MSKTDDKHPGDAMRAEYDFSGGVRGKYAPRHKDVNRALRQLADKEAS